MKKLFLILFFLSSCQNNLLSVSASADSDEEYFDQAMAELNDQSYDSAIQTVTTKISSSGQTQVKVRELLASAYAGKCGLNFVDYTNSLAQQSSGSAMSVMMAPFVGITADPASCKLSLQTMELIGDTSVRTANQNLFASIVGMVLLGSALRTSADVAPALGDGVVDVGICAGVTDAQMDDVILGFGFFNKNFLAVSQTLIGNFSGTAMTGAVTACNAVAGAAVCQITDATQITPAVRDAYRDLTNTSDYGIGPVATGGDPLLISTACP